jgi:hypothetical protein
MVMKSNKVVGKKGAAQWKSYNLKEIAKLF